MNRRPNNLMDGFANRTKRSESVNNPTKVYASSGTYRNTSSVNQYDYNSSQHINDNPFMTLDKGHHGKNTLNYNESKSLNNELKQKDKQIKELNKINVANEKLLKKKDEDIHVMQEQLNQFKKLMESMDENKGSTTSTSFNYILNKLKIQAKLSNRSTKDELKTKKILKNEKCFDNNLNRVPKMENSNIPVVIYECVQTLESQSKFMETLGLYRGSANYALIQKLRFKINGNDYSVIREQKDPHTVTNLLKLCLREIKEPLITLKQLYNEENHIKTIATDSKNERIFKLKNLLNSLQPVNYDTMIFLLKHLKKVEEEPENQMTSESLSIVFGACIFYEVMSSLDAKKEETILPNLCIKYMIDNCSDIIVDNHELIKTTQV